MYRTICTELWTDPKVCQLSSEGKLLFVYLITNPHTHLCGLYYLLKTVMQQETALARRAFDGACKGLLSLNLIEYDEDRMQVWVKKMFGFQGKGQKTERGVAYHLSGLHPSPLIERFLVAYPQVVTYLPETFKRYPINGASDPTDVFPSPVPDPSSVPDPEGRRVKRGNGASTVPSEWHLTEEQIAGWVRLGLNPHIEFAAFKDHALTTARRCHDWQAAFRNWCRKSLAKKASRP